MSDTRHHSLFNQAMNNPSKRSYIEEFERLANIIAADQSVEYINNQFSMNDTTKGAIKAFKDSCLTEDALQMFLDVLAAYRNTYNTLSNNVKRALFACQVFGTVERCLPPELIAMLCDPESFYEVLHGKRELQLTRKLKDGADFLSPELGESHFVLEGVKCNGLIVQTKLGQCMGHPPTFDSLLFSESMWSQFGRPTLTQYIKEKLQAKERPANQQQPSAR